MTVPPGLQVCATADMASADHSNHSAAQAFRGLIETTCREASMVRGRNQSAQQALGDGASRLRTPAGAHTTDWTQTGQDQLAARGGAIAASQGWSSTQRGYP
jgi:hypothetical protein